jgi:hypothetical protein
MGNSLFTNYALIWLLKLVLAHLLTDFVLQPASWIKSRSERHFASPFLYLHGLLTGGLAWLFIGWSYWPVALVIFISHTLIDGWKSYRPKTSGWFLIDQALHGIVLLACWYTVFQPEWNSPVAWKIAAEPLFWVTLTAFVFLTFPAGIAIGLLTRRWREKLPGHEGLAEAGRWIGIIERCIVFIFVLKGQYSAIGLLVAAKSILRFGDDKKTEIKTEYLLIGTLISIGVSLLAGIGVLWFRNTTMGSPSH